jgi:hypothetical protein
MPLEPRILDATTKMLSKHPERAAIAVDVMTKLQEGYYDETQLGRVLHQTDPRHRISVAEGWLFASIWSAIHSGEMLVVKIYAGGVPQSDRERDENNKILASISRPFSAKFLGRGHGPDGSVSWNLPVLASSISCGDDECRTRERVTMRVAPSSAALEVGTMPIARAAYYLRGPHALLARWPYNSEYVYMLIPTHLTNPLGDDDVQHPLLSQPDGTEDKPIGED